MSPVYQKTSKWTALSRYFGLAVLNTAVKRRNCAFCGKIMKVSVLVDLKVMNNSRYRGIALSVCKKNKPVSKKVLTHYF